MTTRDEFVTAQIREGKTLSEAIKAWDEYRKANPNEAKSRGSTAQIFAWLKESSRTREEFDEYIATLSTNIQTQKSFWEKVWDLAETVRKGNEVKGRKAA